MRALDRDVRYLGTAIFSPYAPVGFDLKRDEQFSRIKRGTQAQGRR